jgi:hypothetical protein
MMPPRVLVALAVAVFFALLPCAARAADRELIVPFHEGGHLVFDQLSGLRVSPTTGVGYAGPAGIAFRSEKADAFQAGAPGDELATTSVWFAPSADVFVTDHLSVGGFVEVAHTFGSFTSSGQKLELPGTTSLTFLPRIGFYAAFSDRLGLWPRAGFGWTSSESVRFPAVGGAPVRDTFKAMLLDVDLTLVYRFSEAFFVRMGPEVGVTLGGTHTEETAGLAAAADGSVLSISGVVGLGVNLEL